MGLIRLMKRVVGGGSAAVQPTDQIACDLTLATVTPTGGANGSLADLAAQLLALTRRQTDNLTPVGPNALPALSRTPVTTTFPIKLHVNNAIYLSSDANAPFSVSGKSITLSATVFAPPLLAGNAIVSAEYYY